MHRILTPLLLCVICVFAPITVWAVTIPTVQVGNAGNGNDPSAGDSNMMGNHYYGAVGYNYRIGTTEVTVGQYTEFLNAVADTDTYALYGTSMATDPIIAGISRSGFSGSYSYSVIGSADHPVTYVSWGDAARFSNWLHNGQPAGLQTASTTENGAYPLNGATSQAALNAVSRNSGATWFIPAENEWYKAAYHKNDGATGNYWDYPTSTDSVPYSDQPPGSDAPTQSNTANFNKNDSVANGYDDGFAVTGLTSFNVSQNHLTDAGAYTSSTSPYGTFDQAGNVWEWNEGFNGTARGLRGGSFTDSSDILQSSNRGSLNPSEEFQYVGFRVANIPEGFVPEPSTAVLGVLGMAGVCAWGWRRRKHCGRRAAVGNRNSWCLRRSNGEPVEGGRCIHETSNGSDVRWPSCCGRRGISGKKEPAHDKAEKKRGQMIRSLLAVLAIFALSAGCGQPEGPTGDRPSPAAPDAIPTEFAENLKKSGELMEQAKAKEQALQESLKKDPHPIFELAQQAVKDALAMHAGDDSAQAATITVDADSLKTFGPKKWTVQGHLSARDRDGGPRETTWEVEVQILAGKLQVMSTDLEV